jgi:hypothetical protein
LSLSSQTERLKYVEGVTREELMANMLEFLFTNRCLISVPWANQNGAGNICGMMGEAMRTYHGFEQVTDADVSAFVVGYSQMAKLAPRHPMANVPVADQIFLE